MKLREREREREREGKRVDRYIVKASGEDRGKEISKSPYRSMIKEGACLSYQYKYGP